MKTIQILLGIALLGSMIACEDLEDPKSPAERLDGTWMVEDDQQKSTLDAYRLEIKIDAVYEDQVRIFNFDALGTNTYVTADISGLTLTVTEQEMAGFTVRGSATIASDYKKLTWKYYVNDGSGLWDEINATYTKLE